MSDHPTFMQFVAEPTQRRCWLLYRALECAPLDRAIELALRADAFVSDGSAPPRVAVTLARPEPATVAAAATVASAPAPPPAVTRLVDPALPRTAATADVAAAAAKPARSIIQAEQRQRLIDRLATGDKNTDLAAEFGLTPKQVQGVRIGCGREIAARREQRATAQPVAPSLPIAAPDDTAAQPPVIAASVDEVVRFLRQQDDVVVPQGSTGEFLVNARFRLQLEELVSRANRIRARQGKPEFSLTNAANGHPALPPGVAPANGHAVL
jgi:hypothetical protein